MTNKLCLIYNYAQHYRTSIFRLIDQTFECDFVFGNSMGDVRKMDYSLLRGHVKETHTKRLWSGFYYQKGIPSLIRKNYDTFILLGESRALSTWIFLIKAKFYKKKKVFLWSHGWYGKETRLERVLKKLMFHLPNGGILLYGNYARNLMIKEGFDGKNLFVIHNSLAYDEQKALREQITSSFILKNHFGNGLPILIFIGRLTAVKRLDLIIDAMALLRTKGQMYNLVFVGDGSERQKLQQKVETTKLEKYVWFYGACYDEKANAELIYNADLCVAPGNVGLTAMHTMMFGTPVLTHNSFEYQMPEFEAISDGVTGGFFQRNNAESLAKSIDDWFKRHGNNREAVRNACYHEIDTQWTPQFQLEVIKKAFEAC